MRKIHTIVHHYLLTRYGWEDRFRRDDGSLDGLALVAEVRRWHTEERRWADIGYHAIIDTDGNFWPGRPLERVGAGVLGRNDGKVHLAYVGGVDEWGVKGADTRTDEQRNALYRESERIMQELALFPHGARIVGHRDLAATHCPGYDVIPDYADWKEGRRSRDREWRDWDQERPVVEPVRIPWWMFWRR